MTQYHVTLTTIAVMTGMLILMNCSGDDSTGPSSEQVSEIRMFPQEASLEVGQQIDFSVVALTATGDTVDTNEIEIDWQWWSTDTDVFTVEPGGLATAHYPGEAFCMIEAVVDVTHRAAEEIDVIHAGLRFPSAEENNNDEIMHLTLENHHEVLETEKAFLKKRLRFTGRDSAFIVVF